MKYDRIRKNISKVQHYNRRILNVKHYRPLLLENRISNVKMLYNPDPCRYTTKHDNKSVMGNRGEKNYVSGKFMGEKKKTYEYC